MCVREISERTSESRKAEFLRQFISSGCERFIFLMKQRLPLFLSSSAGLPLRDISLLSRPGDLIFAWPYGRTLAGPYRSGGISDLHPDQPQVRACLQGVL
jgi:hypothetical protein